MIIKNILNSPQQIMTDKGPLVLGANEKAEIGGFAPAYDGLYRASAFLTITEGDDEMAAPSMGEVNTSSERVKEAVESEPIIEAVAEAEAAPDSTQPRPRGRPRKSA